MHNFTICSHFVKGYAKGERKVALWWGGGWQFYIILVVLDFLEYLESLDFLERLEPLLIPYSSCYGGASSFAL